ncbi:hypothetical protein [Aureivirga sp. CE67]|uniref:hypothetical protein n=1 Tax=Aureivirga sp. CE67 TaxID=1788983 RepID=UPI0018CB7F42|nr:hypothetical protein [Aureivirga sp. CE67]
MSLIVISITIISCATHAPDSKPKLKLSENDILVKQTPIYNQFLSGKFTELKFSFDNNVQLALFSKKGVFDTFGKWNNNFKLKNTSVYQWYNVKLFPNMDKRFSILAFGTDSPNFYTSSIIVCDSEGKDAIKAYPNLKDKIINFYVEMVNNLDYADHKFKNANQQFLSSN